MEQPTTKKGDAHTHGGLTKMQFVLSALCTIQDQTPFSLMVKTNLSLQVIYGYLGQLCLGQFMRKTLKSRNMVYTSYLSIEEIENGLRRWDELQGLYPEIAEFNTRRKDYARRTEKSK